MLPKEYGRSSLLRIIRVYSTVWEKVYGFKPKITNYGKLGGIFKRLFTDYTEYQIACFILLHFDWRGATGEDDFTYKRLQNKCFPLEWVASSTNQYRAYLQNSIKLEFDNPEEVKKYVDGILSRYEI